MLLPIKVGVNVHRLRTEQGLTQEDLASRSRLCFSTVGSIERGQRNCSLNTLCKIAAVLGVSVGELLK